MSFIQFSDILPSVVKKSGASQQIGEAFMLVKAPKIIARVLGVDIADRLRLLYIKHQILVMACVDDRLEIVIREEENKIIQEFGQEFGFDKVKKFQFLQ
jgi:hypothetical protein